MGPRADLPNVRGADAGEGRYPEDAQDVSHREERSTDPDRRTTEPPPGYFVSDQLASDCLRFLEEIKQVVRRRIEAGLSRPH